MLVHLAQASARPDDARNLIVQPVQRHGFAHGLIPCEEGQRRALVDDDRILRALHVRFADEPPVEQRFMHHIEIARTNGVNRRLRALGLRGEGKPLRPRANRACRDGIRDGGKLLLRLFVQRVQFAALLCRRRRGQDVFQSSS